MRIYVRYITNEAQNTSTTLQYIAAKNGQTKQSHSETQTAIKTQQYNKPQSEQNKKQRKRNIKFQYDERVQQNTILADKQSHSGTYKAKQTKQYHKPHSEQKKQRK